MNMEAIRNWGRGSAERARSLVSQAPTYAAELRRGFYWSRLAAGEMVGGVVMMFGLGSGENELKFGLGLVGMGIMFDGHYRLLHGRNMIPDMIKDLRSAVHR